jgi:hypothetical protein
MELNIFGNSVLKDIESKIKKTKVEKERKNFD